MPTKRVNEPILDGGLRTANYLNGRLLSANDLQVDQEAVRLRVARLAQAVGPGVVHGLKVTGHDRLPDGHAAFQISPGLAINGQGQTLVLSQEITLTFSSPPGSPASFGPQPAFVPHLPQQPSSALPSSATLRLLVIGPANGHEGVVMDQDGPLAGHDRRYSVEGVHFRLIPFPLPGWKGDPDQLRNELAYQLIYGNEDLHSLLCQRCGQALTRADVPLALASVVDRQIAFIDMGIVRRSPEPPVDQIGPRELTTARRPRNEAFYRQFQEQLAETPPAGAVHHFRYLPPVGYLPTPFNWPTFFAGAQVEEAAWDPSFLQAHTEPAWWADPIDLKAPPPLWVYTPPEADYVLFLRRHREEGQSGQPAEPRPAPAILVEAPAAAGIEVRVSAAGEDGLLYPGRPDGSRFRIDNLSPGAYTLWVRAAGHKTAARRLVLQPGEVEQISLALRPAAPVMPPPARPTEQLPAPWLKPGKRRHLVLLWKHPGDGELPESLRGWPMEHPPKEMLPWLRSWGGWLAATQPELPIDPDGLRLLVNPRRSPFDPWAYALYGVGGVRIPLAIPIRVKVRRDARRPLLRPAEAPAEVQELPFRQVAAAQQPRKGGWLKRLFSKQ